MPHSIRDNDHDVRNYVQEHGLSSALDVGAGSGTYGHLLRDLMANITAIEVWKPYVTGYSLAALYDSVLVRDVRDLARNQIAFEPRFDLIIFGDILEHMTEDEGVKVWEWAKTVAEHGIISVPIIHWPQGAIDGNPYEAHVQDCLHTEDFRRVFGPFDAEHVYTQTATFMVEFAPSGTSLDRSGPLGTRVTPDPTAVQSRTASIVTG